MIPARSTDQDCACNDLVSHLLRPPQFERHGRFLVVRDDLVPGGTKARALLRLLLDKKPKLIAYACDRFGYGPIAVAYVSRLLEIRALLIFPNLAGPSPTFDVVREFSNVDIFIDSSAKTQGEAFLTAKTMAERTDARLFPVGFDLPEFGNALQEVASSLKIEPAEVWSLAGSGSLSRALQTTWPRAEVHAVSMGFPHVNVGRAIVHLPPEQANEPAKWPPPFPSAAYYDAKIWDIANARGRDGALIWNVA